MQRSHYRFLFIKFCTISYGTPWEGDNVRDALEHEFPSTVALDEMNSEVSQITLADFQFCTGSLITRKNVLTAEHCILKKDSKNVLVYAGSADLDKCQSYDVETWITYQKWKYSKSDKFPPYVHDVAILTLKSNIVDNMQPAIVPQFTPHDVFNTEVKAAGWGFTNNDVKPKVLRTVDLKVLTKENCDTEASQLMKENFTMANWILCTRSMPWALTECGDSGGPLLNNHNELIGITLGSCPQIEKIFENYPCQLIWMNRLLEQRINIHASLHHYKKFILHFTNNTAD